MDCPIWLDELIRGHSCTRLTCTKRLSPRSIRGVGTAVVDAGIDVPFERNTHIQITCEHCGREFTLAVDATCDDLIEGVRWLYHHGSELLTPQHGQVEADPDRGVQALGPWEESEVRPFIERLRRTSFRRSSRSFQQWLKRLRGDSDDSPYI